MLKCSTRVLGVTTDAPCRKGWKSTQMWALVSSRWKSTGRACDSSLCFSKSPPLLSPPLLINRLYSESRSGPGWLRVQWQRDCTGSALERFVVPGAITVPAPSRWTPSLDLLGMMGEIEQGPKLAWVKLCSSTGGNSRVVLWGQRMETKSARQSCLRGENRSNLTAI